MSKAAERALRSGVRLPPLPSVSDLVKLYRIQAAKRLSQNFLLDERITDKFVRRASHIRSCDTVLEVGPGPGAITRSIMRRAPERLVLVEKDPRFTEILELLQEAGQKMGTQVDVHIDDVLRYDFTQALPRHSEGRLHLLGNLPFSISTPLLIKWYEDISLRRGAFSRPDTTMALTFQEEVAVRICAPIGHMERCRLSVMSEIWTYPSYKFKIPGTAFVPKPDVDVGVVKIVPLLQPRTQLPFRLVERVVRTIFNTRQKYIRFGFSMLLPPELREEYTSRLLDLADVDEFARSFQLSVDEYLRICDVYADFVQQHPEVEHYNYRGAKQPLLSED